MATFIPAVGAAVAKVSPAIGSFFGGGGAAAGSTAATAAGTSTASASAFSTVLSAGSALAAIGGGFAANERAKTEAEFAKAQAAQEEAGAASRAADISREHEDLRSEQTVIQLANGLDIGVGTPVNIRRSANQAAQRNISVTRENARNRSKISRLRSRGLLSEGRAALYGGLGTAAAYAADNRALTG